MDRLRMAVRRWRLGVGSHGSVARPLAATAPRRAFAVLLVTAFVDMVGLLIVVPLLPFYAMRFGASGAEIGLLVSAYAVAQLLSAPFWGRVSDRWGRRPALLAGLGASALAYVVFAQARAWPTLLVARLVQGAGGGTAGVLQAYVSDTTPPQRRAQALGWVSAVTSAGVMVGPVLGSWLAQVDPALPGWAAAALCLANAVFAWRFLPEAHTGDREAQPGAVRQALATLVRQPTALPSRLVAIYALGMMASMGTNAVLALLLARRFGVTEATIGYVFLYTGALSVVARAGLLGPLLRALGEGRLARLGLVALAAGLAVVPWADRWPTLLAALALGPLGSALTFPCVTALLSQRVPARQRGVYLGLQQTFGGLARVLGPAGAGWAWDALGPAAPYLAAAALSLLALALARSLPAASEASLPAP